MHNSRKHWYNIKFKGFRSKQGVLVLKLLGCIQYIGRAKIISNKLIVRRKEITEQFFVDYNDLKTTKRAVIECNIFSVIC